MTGYLKLKNIDKVFNVSELFQVRNIIAIMRNNSLAADYEIVGSKNTIKKSEIEYFLTDDVYHKIVNNVYNEEKKPEDLKKLKFRAYHSNYENDFILIDYSLLEKAIYSNLEKVPFHSAGPSFTVTKVLPATNFNLGWVEDFKPTGQLSREYRNAETEYLKIMAEVSESVSLKIKNKKFDLIGNQILLKAETKKLLN